MRKKYLVWVILVGIISVALFVQTKVAHHATVDNDEISYSYDAFLVLTGKNPLAFGSARGFGLWPFLALWLGIVGTKSFFTIKLFSSVIYVFSALCLFLIFKFLRKEWAGIIAVFLYSFSPYLLSINVGIHTQNLQLLFLLLAILFFVVSTTKSNKEYLFIVLSGLTAGYAYLVRENSLYTTLLLTIAIFVSTKSFRHLIVFVAAWVGTILSGLVLFAQGVGFAKFVFLYQRFLSPTNGVTGGSVIKNISDISGFIYYPYSFDLVFYVVLSLGVLLLSLLIFTKKNKGLYRISTYTLFSGTLLSLLIFLSFGFSFLKNYDPKSCVESERGNVYCLRDKTRDLLGPTVALSALGILMLLAYKQLDDESEIITANEAAIFGLLFLPPLVSYLKHVRFTLQYISEFYPAFIFLAALIFYYLVKNKRVIPLGIAIFVLVLSYKNAYVFLDKIPLSGSYTQGQIRELGGEVKRLSGGDKEKVFTGSTMIAEVIGGESLLNIGHPISYGTKLPDALKFALYPTPKEIINKMETSCNRFVLEDKLTKDSYYWNEEIENYISKKFTQRYPLDDDSDFKLLERKSKCK